MRLILMGTGPFAVPSFEKLRAEGHEILVVISRPEQSGGNSKKAPPPSPVRLWAESHGLPTAAPLSMNTDESVDWLRGLQADLLFVCDYGQILSSACLAASRLGGINLHGSLLPRHRGAAPVQWSILAGDRIAGSTIIHMTPGLDAGPILSTIQTEIGVAENAQELERRLSELGTQATLTAIERLQHWDPATTSPGEMQDSKLATKAPRLKKMDGVLDCRYPCEWIDRQIRGLQPWPGCFANIQLSKGSAIRLLIQSATPVLDPISERDSASSNASRLSSLPEGNAARVSEPVTSLEPMSSLEPVRSFEAGELLYGDSLKNYKSVHPGLASAELAIRVQNGWLVLNTVQPAGKRSMSAAEFARGYCKQDWMRVESITEPHKLLDRMMAMEVKS